MSTKKPKPTYYHPLADQYVDHSYKYYDTPDGKDFCKKLWYTTKLGLKTGYVVGGFYALSQRNRALSRLWLLYDGARVGIPIVIASATYTITTHFLTNFRNKDDEHNAQVGGAVAGALLGTLLKTPNLGVLFTLFGAYFCGLKKIAVMNDYDFPFVYHHRKVESSWALRKLDFTLTPDIPGNWTTTPPARPKPPPPPPPPPPPTPPPTLCDSFGI